MLCSLPVERPDDDFPTFLSTINRQLRPLNLELAQARMEDSPALWCGLVNRSPDAAAKISSKFSPAELELFNKVVSDILFSIEGGGGATCMTIAPWFMGIYD